MERRAFIGLVGGAVAWPVVVASGWPMTASAQQSGGRIPRVAYLGPSSAAITDPSYMEQFKVGLVENDLIVGRNIAVEYFWADGSPDRLRELADQLGQQNFDVVVTVGPQAYRFLKAAQTKSQLCLR
jgi:putative ABC transport system substrate-binding protein